MFKLMSTSQHPIIRAIYVDSNNSADTNSTRKSETVNTDFFVVIQKQHNSVNNLKQNVLKGRLALSHWSQEAYGHTLPEGAVVRALHQAESFQDAK